MSRRSLCAWWLAMLAMSVVAVVQAQTPLRQVVLVQISGWMEPFYEDASSPLKPLVAA